MIAADTSVWRDLADGSKLEFVNGDGARRAYYLHPQDAGKRRRLPSATTILGILNKPALIAWGEEQGAIGAVKAVRLGEIDEQLPDDEIIGRVRMLELGADAAKRQAANRGLTVHDALEVWSRDGDLPDPADLDPEHRPYLQGLARALLTLEPEPICVEQITCSTEHGFAGRFDMRARIDGVDTLLDLKTSKNGHGYPEGHVQLAGYALCEAEQGNEMPERMIVLGVGRDGSFAADDCCASTETFLAVLAAYQAMKAVNRGVSALTRAAKKAREAMA